MAKRTGEQPEVVQKPLRYTGAEGAVLLFANQFALQREADGVVLTVGQSATPLLLGDEVTKRTQIEEIEYVPIQTLARFFLPVARAIELRDLLAQFVRAVEQEGTQA